MSKVESDFKIIDNNSKAKDEYGHNYGSYTATITLDDIEALLTEKKILATDINGGEYTLFIELGKDCTDKEWQHCRVEKMGCTGCHYDHGKENK